MLVGKPEKNSFVGRFTCRWEDNIKLNFKEAEYADVHWIHVAQDRKEKMFFINIALNLRTT
jgi:hypothetical protein